MNHQQVREIAKTAFEDRFGDIDIVCIDVNPALDHYDDPLVDVRIIYDAAFEDLGTEGTMSVQSEIIDDIVCIDVNPALDHYDDPLVDVRIIYDAAFEDLGTEGTMSVQSEIIDKVWRDTEDSPDWPQVHFISKSDIEEQTSREMNIEDVLTQSYLQTNKRLSSWLPLLSGEFCKPYIFHLRCFLQLERRASHFLGEPDRSVHPEARRVFAALEATTLSRVKVVIVGQDPYHNGEADGLAFSMRDGYSLSSSLSSSLNAIFRAINCDLGTNIPTDGTVHNLEGWAHQGVLLLNTVLSVRSGCPKSHYNQGWEKLTGEIIKHVSAEKRYIAFLLWGKEAQKFGNGNMIASDRGHKVLCAPHPAARGDEKKEFIKAKHFSQTNRHRRDKGIGDINWNLCVAVTANPVPFTGANLDGATLTVTLPSGFTFAGGVSASSFALVTSPTIAGLSIGNVTGGASGATTATLTLATGAGYGFNTPATLAVRVRAAAHSGSDDITSTTLPLHPSTEQAE